VPSLYAYAALKFSWPAFWRAVQSGDFNMKKPVKMLSFAAIFGVVVCDSADFRDEPVRRLSAALDSDHDGRSTSANKGGGIGPV